MSPPRGLLRQEPEALGGRGEEEEEEEDGFFSLLKNLRSADIGVPANEDGDLKSSSETTLLGISIINTPSSLDVLAASLIPQPPPPPPRLSVTLFLLPNTDDTFSDISFDAMLLLIDERSSAVTAFRQSGQVE